MEIRKSNNKILLRLHGNLPERITQFLIETPLMGIFMSRNSVICEAIDEYLKKRGY